MTGPEPRFAVRDAMGAELDPVVPETLRPFLLARGGVDGPAVELTEQVGMGSAGVVRRSLTATPAGDGRWAVTAGIDDGHLVGSAPNTDAVFDLLRSWAADDGWWLDAFAWHRPPDR